jgi:15-cis-phytoene synthase
MTDTVLASSYRHCQRLHRRHGRSYYLATRLLPAWKRRHVHALYGFARYADEIVDGTGSVSVADRATRLAHWSGAFLEALNGDAASARDDPVLAAVLDTIARFHLDHTDFHSFLRSMGMDLEVTEYPDYDALLVYMEGSAAVIGTMLLPLLEPADPVAAREPARQLGLAFQLTNFIRDVGEDLRRGRIYLPMADLARFGLTRAALRRAVAHGRADPPLRALIRYEVARARGHYAAAAAGIPMLARTSQACIRAAYHLYGGILDQVERAGHDVLLRRAVVPRGRRLRIALRCLLTPPRTPVAPLAGASTADLP